MKGISKFAALVAVSALAAVSLAGGLKWETDANKAMAESKKTGKPILADFTGSDWCGWCIRLHKEVFDTPAFAKWASKNVILLELDYPQSKPQPAAIKKQNAGLAQKYKIEGYPTILFLNASGKVLGQYGYDEGGPAKWIPNAEKLIAGKKISQ
jgi:protein disulfide-isomerase